MTTFSVIPGIVSLSLAPGNVLGGTSNSYCFSSSAGGGGVGLAGAEELSPVTSTSFFLELPNIFFSDIEECDDAMRLV